MDLTNWLAIHPFLSFYFILGGIGAICLIVSVILHLVTKSEVVSKLFRSFVLPVWAYGYLGYTIGLYAGLSQESMVEVLITGLFGFVGGALFFDSMGFSKMRSAKWKTYLAILVITSTSVVGALKGMKGKSEALKDSRRIEFGYELELLRHQQLLEARQINALSPQLGDSSAWQKMTQSERDEIYKKLLEGDHNAEPTGIESSNDKSRVEIP